MALWTPRQKCALVMLLGQVPTAKTASALPTAIAIMALAFAIKDLVAATAQ